MDAAPGGFKGKGDLRRGDIIVAVGGKRVRTRDELIAVFEILAGPIDIVFFNPETGLLEQMVIVPVNGALLGLWTVQAPISN
jgi:hypothetical protein